MQSEAAIASAARAAAQAQEESADMPASVPAYGEGEVRFVLFALFVLLNIN